MLFVEDSVSVFRQFLNETLHKHSINKAIINQQNI